MENRKNKMEKKLCAVTLQNKLSESNSCTLSISFMKTHHTFQSQRNRWSSFIEITVWHGCSPVNLLHIFRIPFFPKNSSLEGCFWKLYLSKQYFLGIQKVPSNFLKKTTKKSLSFNFEILTEPQENRFFINFEQLVMLFHVSCLAWDFDFYVIIDFLTTGNFQTLVSLGFAVEVDWLRDGKGRSFSQTYPHTHLKFLKTNWRKRCCLRWYLSI